MSWIQQAGIVVSTLILGSASAQSPQLGGPMQHVLVYQAGSALEVEFESPLDAPLMMRNYGDSYSPPADVLNGTFYNGQYGWLLGSFISLPPGASALWVETVDQTAGLRAYDRFTWQPILATDGASARWAWDGTMAHNWYAADDYGLYEATYTLYFGDAAGAPTPGYTPGIVTLRWRVCPCDLAEDGTDVFDLLAYLDLWFAADAGAEWSGDAPAQVDVFDLLAFLDCWFTQC